MVQKKTILYLLDDKEDALYANTEMEDFLGKDNVLYFPESYLEPYQVEKTQNANLVLRTEVLDKIISEKSPKVIVTDSEALSEKVLKKEDLKAISHHIKVGDRLNFNFVDELLNYYHFRQTDFVSEPGEFSVRGGIVDIFSYSHEMPYRITFFGNEVESIKIFNIETQLSVDKVKNFKLVSNMNFSIMGSKVSLLQFLPKESFVVSKNGMVGMQKIRTFYKKSIEKYETLSKDIAYITPQELFISDQEFLFDYRKFRTVDFGGVVINGLKEIIEIKLEQLRQPSFHKNFKLLINDSEEKQNARFNIWIPFSTE